MNILINCRTTNKRYNTKVGYVTLQAKKITPTEKREWLLSCVDLTGYDETFTTDKDRLQFIANEIKSICFCDNNLKRFNNNKTAIIADHLQGLPSYLDIPFSNFDIINLGRLWGYDLSGKKEDKFIENYWNAIANLLLQTFKKYGVEL